ncbi:hypothetical protein DTO006G1_1154 [Penicillium roqueforti]|nr:hypothetical protein CBS147337_6783 [Penicillium roqueforti]KAI2676207.1 hypothetical protein LCP963914a_8452 [Penicillium roqueforti]KAI2683313.1 hypothetical protein CBS147355_2453 [Penicillium roqueforti]KAI2695868.1 hypothetical protein CBS147332_9253 [Penicillium roqueforti]KAI2714556.1 hypothetical protein CBS147318_6710 [Penicillium roqueforti]
MIWSLDQDSSSNTSGNDFLGIGVTNGVAATDAEKIRALQARAQAVANNRNSCYWSFCGQECTVGFIPETYAKGQVTGISLDTTCSGDDVQTLCCVPGTNTGTCDWYGWRGVGMPCVTGYCPEGSDLIAINTNSYVDDSDLGAIYNLTCNGGSQSYCCSDFVPSSYANTDSLNLVGQDGLTKRGSRLSQKSNSNEKSIAKRGVSSSTEDPTCLGFIDMLGAVFGSRLVWAIGSDVTNMWGAESSFNYYQEINDMCVKPTEVIVHDKGSGADGVVADAAAKFGQGAVGPGVTDIPRKTITTIEAAPATAVTTIGDYSVTTFSTTAQEDCSVTYTCSYGKGFDEVCDNQRWAIDKGLGGKTVYHKAPRRPGRTFKDTWNQKRGAQCDISRDEFPLASFLESARNAYQVVRLINGPANALHGRDYGAWLAAVYVPCSALRARQGKPAPPITVKFGDFPVGDHRNYARLDDEHFIPYYGFDSQTRDSSCWATYTWGQTTTVSDQGFRAMPNDPMYMRPYFWPAFNNYRAPPSDENLPTEIFSAQWLKREVARSVLQQDLPLSAIYETEQAAEILEGEVIAPPTATDPSSYSDKTFVASQTASPQTSTNKIARETGGAHARMHPHGHGHRKWHY